MGNALLKAFGAQPPKPSKYKPIWTDRFFTGFFSNRNPLRSPLSAYYSEGWNMGKTDTLIDGLNVELSPRLTLIRRPGVVQYSAATLPTAVQSFYNFHRSDGQVYTIADLAGAIYQVNTVGSNTLVYTKPTSSHSRFQGVGGTLYFGDGVSVPRKWDSIAAPSTTYQMGISAPQSAPAVLTNASTGAATSLHGVTFSGSSQSVTTTTASSPTTSTIEFWFASTAANQPIVNLESSQTGNSSQVLQSVWIDNNKNLNYSVWDSQAGAFATVTAFGNQYGSSQFIADGNWHHVVCQMVYNPPGTQSTTATGGAAINPNSNIVNVNSFDPTVSSGFTLTNTNGASAGAAPPTLKIDVWIDGQLFVDYTPPFNTYPSTPGYWRLGEGTIIGSSTYTNNWFHGTLAEVAIYPHTIGTARSHFTALTTSTVAFYELQIPVSNPSYWWKLNETSGTVAADSVGSNTGAYVGSPALNQALTLIYIPHNTSTTYSVGQVIIDTNGNYQRVLTAGTSSATVPTWNKSLQGTTTDGSVVWLNIGQAGLTLSTAQGTFYVYAYAGYNGHVSTCSPPSNSTGPITSSYNRVFVNGSADPQVQNVLIFRVADGGSTPFLVGSIPNPGLNNVYFNDATPDAGLNILMAAPQAHANDPAPYGLTNFTYHLGRMWGSVGNIVYASAGPDVQIGNGNEAWPPANAWNFPAQVQRMFSTSAGLVVCTTSGIFMLAGGPAITQFYQQNLLEKIGISSYDASDSQGSQITLFTNDHSLLTIDASTGFTNVGFPIADKLASFTPSNTYVAYHSSGLDHAIFVSNGSTGWYRCAPQQPPDWQITGPVWSPLATITGGCGAIASCEVTPGQYQLLVGQGAGQYVVARDSTYTVFNDAGTSYAAHLTIGSIVLAAPGELAEVAFITADYIKRGTSPQISVLLDEVSGSFSNISNYVVQDPPLKYGTTLSPSSLFANRYYFRQSVGGAPPPPILCRHMQVYVDFGTDRIMNELISATIYGAVKVE